MVCSMWFFGIGLETIMVCLLSFVYGGLETIIVVCVLSFVCVTLETIIMGDIVVCSCCVSSTVKLLFCDHTQMVKVNKKMVWSIEKLPSENLLLTFFQQVSKRSE